MCVCVCVCIYIYIYIYCIYSDVLFCTNTLVFLYFNSCEPQDFAMIFGEQTQFAEILSEERLATDGTLDGLI